MKRDGGVNVEVDKNKYENMKTTELIDNIEKLDGNEYDKAYEALESREIIRYLQEQITELREQHEGQQVAINKLKRHKHDEQGNPVVSL